MKKMSKLMSTSLAMFLILGIFAALPSTVSAIPTQQSAVAWVKAQADGAVGYDVDGIYGYQCSDFATAYINYLIDGNAWSGRYTTYNGYQYYDISYPAGWEKIANYDAFVPQPGDILVFNGTSLNPNGHVCIAIEGCTTTVYNAVGQSGNVNWLGADYQSGSYFNSYNSFRGVIRPPFGTTPTAPTISLGAVTNLSNTDAKISATVSPLSYVTTCGAYIGTSPSALSKITETTNSNVDFIYYNLSADWKPLCPGTHYYYKIYAVVNGVEYQSALSSFTTTGLAKPTFATISVSKSSVLVGENVTFTFTSNNSASYTIGIDKGTTRIYTSVCTSGYTRSFSEPGSYSAYVTAWNSSGSIDSTKVYFTVASPIPPPATPTGLKAVSTGYNSAKVTWSAVTGASGYEVWRKLWSTGTFSLVSTQTSTSLTNGGLSTNKTYYYKVRAYRLVGTTKVYSKDSALAAVTPVPSTPTGLKVVSGGSKTAKVTWTAVTGASGYEVYRKMWSTGTYTMVSRLTATSLTNSGLTINKTYYYKVRSYRMVGTTKVYGPDSAVVTFTPLS